MNFPEIEPDRAPRIEASPYHPQPQGALQYAGGPLVDPRQSRGRLGGGMGWLALGMRGGLVLSVLVVILELLLPAPIKPSAMIGKWYGSIEAAELAQKQAAQEKFDIAVATARAEGERATAAKYEAQIATLNRDLEVTTQAYATLYQRSNRLADVFLQMQQMMLQYRQQAVARTQGGAALVGTFGSFMCSLGQLGGDASDSGGFCAGTRRVQEGMSSDLSAQGISQEQLYQQIFQDLPDPASLRVRADQTLNGGAPHPGTTAAPAPGG